MDWSRDVRQGLSFKRVVSRKGSKKRLGGDSVSSELLKSRLSERKGDPPNPLTYGVFFLLAGDAPTTGHGLFAVLGCGGNS